MDFSDIIAWVQAILADLANYLIQILQWVWNNLVAIANFIWGHLLDAFHFAWGFLKKVASLFRSLWDNFFKKIWNAVLHAVQKAQAWLEAKLAPIINFLKRVRALYDRWFKQYIKPLLNFLQRIRRIIQILKMLHIHIFDGLDKFLAKVEGKIQQAVLTIRGVLNNLIDIVNIIADPMQILRHPQLVYALRRSALSLFKVFTGLPAGFFIPSHRGSAGKGLGFLPANFTAGDAAYNPVASSFLGNDGLPGGFSGFLPGEIPDDSAIDDLALLDYFDDSLYPEPACSNVESCMKDVIDAVAGGSFVG